MVGPETGEATKFELQVGAAAPENRVQEEYFRGIGVPIDFSDIRLGRQTTQLPPERELERLEDQTWQKLELEAAGPELQRARELERALLAALP